MPRRGRRQAWENQRAQYYFQRASAGLLITEATCRISPFAAYNNTRDPNPEETYAAVVEMLDQYDLAYLHLADTNAWSGAPDMERILKLVKPRWRGVLIGNGGISPGDAAQYVKDGRLDLVAFGRLFLANPDLPARIKAGGPFNEPKPYGWYGGDERGYTDYQTLGAQTQSALRSHV